MTAKHTRLLLIPLFLVALAACKNESLTPTLPPASDRPEPTASLAPTVEPTVPAEIGQILFSEVLIAGPGNNNHEFIELANTGTQPIDLEGWSVWFRLNSNQDEKLIYEWQKSAEVPGLGHLLLLRAGQDWDILGDAEYDVSLFEAMGGLALRDNQGNLVDAVGWGDAPQNFFLGSPMQAPAPGVSLERRPGGAAGNASNNGDNGSDLIANEAPNPQNSGSPLTPLPAGQLVLTLVVPQTVQPGTTLELVLSVENQTGDDTENVIVSLPLPADFELGALPSEVTLSDGRLLWQAGDLPADETADMTVQLQSPWTYLSAPLTGAYAMADNWPLRTYAGPHLLAVAGGSIPIATAQTLVGKTVTIEGIATMYTDAFYSGSTGTKFYLEDQSGGIQVYCPGGLGLVQVELGEQVRVSGEIQVYRSALEIVPQVYPDDVEILPEPVTLLEPLPVTVKQATSDASLPGRLVVVQGTVTSIQEFSYSYELDLIDENGDSQLVYIEKETNINIEALEIGRTYRITGIVELYDNLWQLKPRLQDDLAEVFDPELTLAISAASSIEPGETLEYTLTATNHTTQTLTSLQIVAVVPNSGGHVVEVLDQGRQESDLIVWDIAQLPGGGESVEVHYQLVVEAKAGDQILAPSARVTAEGWPDTVRTNELLTFVGQGVPIWAIQGAGFESPYARHPATTVGVVTGVFPELEGFWIQETETDNNLQTSAGLFVLVAPDVPVNVQIGDQVQVSGQVREMSGQTLLHLTSGADLTLSGSGNELPPAVELDPPKATDDALAYYEALEGMLVQVTEPAVVVAPTTKYGETALVASKSGVDRVMHGEERGHLIFLDDGSSVTHTDLSTLPFALKSGDVLSNIVGPLAYTYNNYKIEPISDPEFSSLDRPLPFLNPAGANSFSVATFNVENFFDFQEPHPSDPPMPSLGEYHLRLSKTAEAIMAMGAPTVVALQEIENIGVLEDLAAEQAISQFHYQAVLVEGNDSRGIDVGYLVRGDRAEIVDVTAMPAPEGLTSRPPLLLTVTLQTLSNETATIYLLNNHFTSMSEGEQVTEPRRVAQAAWNLSLVEQIVEQEPDALIVVLGDLNSFYESPPIDTLREGGLRHIYEFVAPEMPYTYIYEGESETLDHILVSSALYERLTLVEALHIDADYPLAAPDDATPRHVSDHDPLIAVFDFD